MTNPTAEATSATPVVEPSLPEGWERVVGLEVHCELATAS